MPRSTVLVILAILLLMVGFWSFYSDTGIRSQPQTAADIVETEPRPPALRITRDTPSAEEQEAREQKQKELADKQAQLNAEKERLQSQAQSLQTLKQRQGTTGERTSRAYASQINQRDLEIQNLLDTISNYRDAEEQINQQASAALVNQDNAARLAREQVDTSIRLVEQEIQSLENELNYLTNFPGLDYTQSQAKAEQLRTQIANQKNQLTALRSQRVDISASVFGNSNQVKSLADQARQELQSSVQATQERIFDLRTEIDQLQGAQLQSQEQAENLEAQISRAEKTVQEKSQQVQQLEQEVQRLEGETRQE
ncbi:hypothetical protein [Bdellovibrio sp. HCB337]|uniref:hypothetical protein n=1 Tax=Bdellovibrio sp. HCB337 TaxID=3394358 RepID=UPI0039A5BFDE